MTPNRVSKIHLVNTLRKMTILNRSGSEMSYQTFVPAMRQTLDQTQWKNQPVGDQPTELTSFQFDTSIRSLWVTQISCQGDPVPPGIQGTALCIFPFSALDEEPFI